MTRTRMGAGKMIAVIALLGALFGVPAALAQQGPILLESGTTENDVPSPIVTMEDGTQIMVEPPKGPVQGIISVRHEEIVAGEVRISIGGFAGIQTADGWQAAGHDFYFDATGTEFSVAEVEDGWHIVLDKTE